MTTKRYYSRESSLELQWNLLLVSWGGAPGFWKEEAASWSMGAEPGWLSDVRRTGGQGEGVGVDRKTGRQRERGDLMDSSLKLQHEICNLGKLGHQKVGGNKMVGWWSKLSHLAKRKTGKGKWVTQIAQEARCGLHPQEGNGKSNTDNQ